MKESLLEGNIRRQMVKLAVPLLLGNVLQQLYNAADSMIIGWLLGTDAFSAVGIAGSVMNLMIFVLNGFCAGVTVIFAQAYGAGDTARFRREGFVAAALGMTITVLLGSALLGAMQPLLRAMNSPEELLDGIAAYLRLIVLGMPATFLYNLLSSVLRSIGDTRHATAFLAVSAGLNVVLDLLMVGPFGMGIEGAACATVISQLLSAVCCWSYLRRHYRALLCTRTDVGFHRELVRTTLSIGTISALHQSSLYIGKLFVQSAVNTLGGMGIAAFTAASRVEGFANSIGGAGAQAISVFVSQNRGAKKNDRVRQGFRQGLLLHMGMGLFFSVLMYAAARPGVLLFLNAAETQAIGYGVSYLQTVALFYVVCFIGNAYVGYFQGLGKVQVPFFGTTMHISLRAILSFCWVGTMGLKGVAAATGVGWILCVCFQTTVMLALAKREKALASAEKA